MDREATRATADAFPRRSRRVLHVVSGVSPDQRFGGISRVALDLARAQQRRGDRVHLLSTDIGFDRPVPRTLEGVRVTLLRSLHLAPSLGFGTIASPGLPLTVLRLLRHADLVHVHLAREPNTLIPAMLAQLRSRPLVLQTHGMLDAPSHRLAVMVDLLLTAPVMRRATTVLTLSLAEDREVARLSGGQVMATRFPNGVGLPDSTDVSRPRDSVLFLSRLHPRKGAVEFARAAVALSAVRPELTFDIVGPDEGDAREVRGVIAAAHVGASVVLHGGVAHHEVADLMRSAVLYCLPARGEPFGLAVLEALSAGTPVLLHQSAELADTVVSAGAGWMFGDGPANDLQTMLARILADGEELRRRGCEARRLVAEQFTIEAVASRLDAVYQQTVGGSGLRRRSAQQGRGQVGESAS